MKTENLSIGLRVLYHAIEWLTVFLILLIFAVQIITPLYAVRVGRADSFCSRLQWPPYRPGVLALGVMLAAVGTILSKCSHEVDSGFLSRSSWRLYLLEGVLYSASALIFQQNCDKIALFAIVDMVDDPRALRQKRFLSAMIVVYLFCNMDAATSAPPCRDAETIPGFLQPAHPQRPAAGDREPVGAGNDTLHPVHGAVHQPADQRETGDPEPEPAAASRPTSSRASTPRRAPTPHRCRNATALRGRSTTR